MPQANRQSSNKRSSGSVVTAADLVTEMLARLQMAHPHQIQSPSAENFMREKIMTRLEEVGEARLRAGIERCIDGWEIQIDGERTKRTGSFYPTWAELNACIPETAPGPSQLQWAKPDCPACNGNGFKVVTVENKLTKKPATEARICDCRRRQSA